MTSPLRIRFKAVREILGRSKESSIGRFMSTSVLAFSPRSVAGAGVIDNEDISFRHSRVMSTSKAARKDSSCYKFLDPIMGAVIAGSDITQTTASV